MRPLVLLLLAGTCLVLVPGADANVVEPLLDTSVIDRIHQLAPLGLSGDKIALNATSSKPGKKVGPTSNLIRDGVYVANADGTDLHQVWAAPQGVDLSGLTATGDGLYAAWTRGFNQPPLPKLLDVTTEKTVSITGPHTARTDGFVSGEHRMFATFANSTSLRQVDLETGALKPVAVKGSGHGGVAFDSLYVRSISSKQLGVCAVTGKRTHPTGLRIGVLDTSSAVLRTMSISSGTSATDGPSSRGDHPTCAVSDDGSTVGTVVHGPTGLALVAMRGGRPVTVRLPDGVMNLASLSGNGRYALAGSGFGDEVDGASRMVELQKNVVVVDLVAGKVARVRNLEAYSRNYHGSAFLYGSYAVWSSDGSKLAVAPQSGGVMIIDSASGRVTFVRNPAPPVGFAFAYRTAHAVGFSSDGENLVFTLNDQSEDITVAHPYSVPIGGGRTHYLLSRSMRSFQRTVVSEDGSRTWVLPSSTCHSVYPQPLLRLVAGTLWDSPFETTPDNDTYSDQYQG